MIKSYPMAVYLRVLARLALGILRRLRRVQAGGAGAVRRADRRLRPALVAVHSLAVWGLVGLELCAGLGDRQPALGLWLVVALLALFIPVLGYGIAIGLDISCGCLGRADLSSLPQALLRDLLLLTLAGALLRYSRPVLPFQRSSDMMRLQSRTLMATLIAASFALGGCGDNQFEQETKLEQAAVQLSQETQQGAISC